jgi:hypothetical protein
MSTTTESVRMTAGRRVAWRGPAAMAVMLLGMADTMLPGAHVLPVIAWLGLYLGLALAVAVPVRGAECCTPLAAHRALGLIVMAGLTVAMSGMAGADAPAGASAAAAAHAMSMPAMAGGLPLAQLVLAAAGVYALWSLWKARHRAARLEMVVAAAAVGLMGAFVLV